MNQETQAICRYYLFDMALPPVRLIDLARGSAHFYIESLTYVY